MADCWYTGKKAYAICNYNGKDYKTSGRTIKTCSLKIGNKIFKDNKDLNKFIFKIKQVIFNKNNNIKREFGKFCYRFERKKLDIPIKMNVTQNDGNEKLIEYEYFTTVKLIDDENSEDEGNSE